jgi:hypothetical protein
LGAFFKDSIFLPKDRWNCGSEEPTGRLFAKGAGLNFGAIVADHHRIT